MTDANQNRETKSLDALRQAQREVDAAARQHALEAARLLNLAEDIAQRIKARESN